MSVIVPARNAAAVLPRLLDALDRQTVDRGTFDVWVIDDCSTDATARVVERSGMATVLRLERHGGPYVARNLGLDRSSGRLLAFTDADCLPAPDWIERGLAAFDGTGADLVGGRIDVPLSASASNASLVDFVRFVDQERAVSRGAALGGNMWVPRSSFARFGRWNDRLLSGGDSEFARRATASGARLRYADDVVVAHEPHARAAKLARKAWRIGYGAAQHRRHATGPLRDRAQMCRHPGYYVPKRQVLGMARLTRTGRTIGRRRLLAMLVVQYTCVDLPMVLGNAAGTLSRGRFPALPVRTPRRDSA